MRQGYHTTITDRGYGVMPRIKVRLVRNSDSKTVETINVETWPVAYAVSESLLTRKEDTR